MEMRPLRWDREKTSGTEGNHWIFTISLCMCEWTAPCAYLIASMCVCLRCAAHLNIYWFQRTVRCVKRAKHPWKEQWDHEREEEKNTRSLLSGGAKLVNAASNWQKLSKSTITREMGKSGRLGSRVMGEKDAQRGGGMCVCAGPCVGFCVSCFECATQRFTVLNF